MKIQPLCEGKIAETIRAVREESSISAAAVALGIGRSTLQHRLRVMAARGLLPDDIPERARPPEGWVVKGRMAMYDASGNLRRQTIRTGPEPGPKFKAPPGHVIKGRSALVDAEGRVTAEWIKTREAGPSPVDIAAAVRAALADVQPLPPMPDVVDDPDTDLMAAYIIADPHIGMLAWGRETGQAYDLAIATRDICSSIDQLVAQTPRTAEALILWMGDTTHSNDHSNRTPASGHQLDVDGRFAKVLRATADIGLHVTRRALQCHKRVRKRFIPGNHDPEAAIALTLAMDMAFAADPRVTVDTQPGLHFFHRFGSVLIGATHGHTMPPERMAMMLAADRPQDWGQTKHRHFFFGHVHKDSRTEVGGVTVESFNAAAARDAYAQSGGWRSGRAVNRILFHKDRGEIGRARVNLG